MGFSEVGRKSFLLISALFCWFCRKVEVSFLPFSWGFGQKVKNVTESIIPTRK